MPSPTQHQNLEMMQAESKKSSPALVTFDAVSIENKSTKKAETITS